MSKMENAGTRQAMWEALVEENNERGRNAFRDFCSFRIDPEDAAKQAGISVVELWNAYLDIMKEENLIVDERVEKTSWFLCRHGSDDERVAREIGVSVESLVSILEEYPEFRIKRMLGDANRGRNPLPAHRELNTKDKKQYAIP